MLQSNGDISEMSQDGLSLLFRCFLVFLLALLLGLLYNFPPCHFCFLLVFVGHDTLTPLIPVHSWPPSHVQKLQSEVSVPAYSVSTTNVIFAMKLFSSCPE